MNTIFIFNFNYHIKYHIDYSFKKTRQIEVKIVFQRIQKIYAEGTT